MVSKLIVRILGVLLMVAVVICYGCGGAEDASVDIGVIIPLTGEAAFYGQSLQKGLDFAAEEVNKGGGIKGRTVVLHYEDSRAVPADGVAALQKLLASQQIVAVVGDAASSVTMAFAPIAEERGVVVMSPLSSASALTDAGDFIFRNVPSDLENGRTAAAFVVNDRKWSRAAVVYVNNEFGVGLRDAFSQACSSFGGQVVISEAYEQGSSDFRSQLAKVKNQQPEAVFVVGYAEVATLLVQAKELGIDAAMIGTGLMEDPNLLATAGDAAEGMFFTQLPYDATSESEVVNRFVQGFKTAYDASPDIISAYGYDALRVVCFALASCDDLTSVALKEQLYRVQGFEGVTGTISFDENGDVQQPMGVKVIRDGQFLWEQPNVNIVGQLGE